MSAPTYLATPVASQELKYAAEDNQGSGHKAGDAGAGDDSSKKRGPQQKQYDTPPESYADAVSPLSSRKGGTLRAESLGVSPSAGRGLGKPISEFGAGAQVKPASFFGNTNAAGALLQLSKGQQKSVHPVPTTSIGALQQRTLPGIAELDLPRGSTMEPSIKEPQGPPNRNLQDSIIDLTHTRSRNPQDVNPYAFRADEIGLSHGISGVGHLGPLLEPPGWKEGDEPIPPQEVEQLYNLSRKKARDELEKLPNQTFYSSLNAQRSDHEGKEKKWNADFAVDALVMKERITVYEQYKERQRNKAQLGRPKVPPPLPSLTEAIPQNVAPPSTTSLSVQQDPFRANHNAYFGSNAISNPEPVIRNHDVHANPALQPSHSGYVDSGNLDPSLLTTSFNMVYDRYYAELNELARIKGEIDNRYRAEENEIMKRKGENDQMLGSFIAKHGQVFSNGPISPAVRTPVSAQFNQPVAANFNPYSLQAGFTQPPAGFPRPPAYRRPAVAGYGYNVGSGENPLHPNYPYSNSFRDGPEPLYQGGRGQLTYPSAQGPAHQGPAHQGSAIQGPAHQIPALQSRTNESSINGGRTMKGRANEGRANATETQVTTTEVQAAFTQLIAMNSQPDQNMGDTGDSDAPAATKKTRAPRKRVDKPLSWYHNEVVKANPPTSQISQAAMQAGIEYGKTGVTPKKAAAQKLEAAKSQTYGRGKKPVIDPVKGVRVSKEVAATLIAQGAKDSTGGRLTEFAKAIAAAKDAASANATSQSSVTGKNSFKLPTRSARGASQAQGKATLQASGSQQSSATPDPTISESMNAKRRVTSKNSIISLENEEDAVSEPSSVEAEDPKDASFGKHITTPSKVSNAGPSTRSGTKRKAMSPKSTGPSSAKKKSRTTSNVAQADGTCDDSHCSADEDMCSPIPEQSERKKRSRVAKP